MGTKSKSTKRKAATSATLYDRIKAECHFSEDEKKQLIAAAMAHPTDVIKDDGRVRVVECTIDPRCVELQPAYQRGLQSHVAAIAKDYDPALAGIVHVAVNDDGSAESTDGSNRMGGAIQSGHFSVKAFVWTGLTEQEKALQFAEQNKNRKNITTMNKYNALCYANDPIAMIVHDIADEYDLTVAQGNSDEPRTISSVTMAMDITKKAETRYGKGYDALHYIINTLEAGEWLNHPNCTQSAMVYAMYVVWEYLQHNPQDEAAYTDRLTQAFKNADPRDFYSAARGVKSNSSEFRGLLADFVKAIAEGRIGLSVFNYEASIKP